MFPLAVALLVWIGSFVLWRTEAQNIAIGRPVVVSSCDFVAVCVECCKCRNDNGDLPWNEGFTYYDQLEKFRKDLVAKDKGYDAAKVVVGDKNEKYASTIETWCGLLFNAGKPDSVMGTPTPETKFDEIKSKKMCWDMISELEPLLTKPPKEYFDPDYMQSCRFRGGELSFSKLTDGVYMDPKNNGETNRMEEVRKTCFKSKWQKNPWVAVDLGKDVNVGKVKLFNRLEAKGNWKIGNYPVHPKLKNMPAVDNPPWVWDRLDRFQVFVLDSASRWRTWADHNIGTLTSDNILKNGEKFHYSIDVPWDFWEIAKKKADAGYPEKLKDGSTLGGRRCGNEHKMDAWKKEFNENDAHLKQSWKDFAARNYPYVVDCGGITGRFVAVRLLNDDRSPVEETNFLNDSPLTLCEIEVEKA